VMSVRFAAMLEEPAIAGLTQLAAPDGS